jgi:hypothetical protein
MQNNCLKTSLDEGKTTFKFMQFWGYEILLNVGYTHSILLVDRKNVYYTHIHTGL